MKLQSSTQCRINHGAGGAPAPGPPSLGGLKILQILHASQLLAKHNIVIFQNLGHTKFCYNFFTYIFIIIIITNIMQYTFSFFAIAMCIVQFVCDCERC